MSIAGGYHRAVERACQIGCQCVQIFTKNNNQWRAKPISHDEAEIFQKSLTELGISHPIAHAAYLINLATPDPNLWQRSIDSFVVELKRAEMLGIPYVVTHPGCYTTGTLKAGIRRIIRALNQIHRETDGLRSRCLLETTAGQGSSIGHRFDHLTAILEGIKHPDRVGVCVDTCHVFAAGYPLAGREEYEATMEELERTVGLETVKAIHLNDSARDLGSRVDRHAHIARGKMGLEPFRKILNDPRFVGIPMYLETPKGEENGKDLDAINLETLRQLVQA